VETITRTGETDQGVTVVVRGFQFLGNFSHGIAFISQNKNRLTSFRRKFFVSGHFEPVIKPTNADGPDTEQALARVVDALDDIFGLPVTSGAVDFLEGRHLAPGDALGTAVAIPGGDTAL
jgi:hypothetical protein